MKRIFKSKSNPWIEIKTGGKKLTIHYQTDFGSHVEWQEIKLKYDEEEKRFVFIKATEINIC